MNKYASLRMFCLIVSIVIIVTSCRKPVSLPASAPVNQLGKIIYYSNLSNTQMGMANYDGSNITPISIGTNTNLLLINGVVQMSPDNKTIYFAMKTPGSANQAASNGIYSCNLDGSNLQLLLSAYSNPGISLDAIYYSASQPKILFRKNRLNGTNELADIWTANLDGTDQKQINFTLPENTAIEGEIPTIVSQDNKTIFFTLSSGNIYSCSINGGNATLIALKGSPCDTYLDGSQHERLLFNDSFGKGLQTVNLDGTDIQNIAIKLPSGVNPPGFIQVSPDSKTIFFSAISQTTYAQGIYSCNIDGSNVKSLMVDANTFHGFVIKLAF